ncbi:MAG: tRNA pseudouridine(38-40) synthase TruA [Opitutales bacterium]|nr:tRNA pseudouridine(38-40) synthase TruA [Opitutales bacterium]
MPEQRFKCFCSYDGTAFKGWQSQLGGGTLQDAIEDRLFKIFGKKIRVHASGRTDAGVHALEQVFHFDAEWRHPARSLMLALKSGLPEGLVLSRVVKADGGFHARYSAVGKRYAYNIFEGDAPAHLARYFWSVGDRRLDIEKMNEAASKLLGEHDFTAFSANRGGGSKDNPVKTLYKLSVRRRGKKVRIETEGSGYMYKMVRLIAGALFDVGTGRLAPEEIGEILESKSRSNKFQAAPAKGLFLERVFYKRPSPRSK